MAVHLPELKLHPEVQVLPLPEFPRSDQGVLWQGGETPVLQGMIGILERAAKQLGT